MPKRIVDGEGLWHSNKLAKVQPESFRAEYANLLPLALGNGSFECDPQVIWATVYAYNRPSITVADVIGILDEFERVKLLFRWTTPDGKVHGYWTGIDKKGRLPSPSQLEKGHYPKGAIPPADKLNEFFGLGSDQATPKQCVGTAYATPTQGVGNALVGIGEGVGVGTETENPNSKSSLPLSGKNTAPGGADGQGAGKVQSGDETEVKALALDLFGGVTAKFEESVRTQLATGVSKEKLLKALRIIVGKLPETEKKPALFLQQNFDATVTALVQVWEPQQEREKAAYRRGEEVAQQEAAADHRLSEARRRFEQWQSSGDLGMPPDDPYVPADSVAHEWVQKINDAEAAVEESYNDRELTAQKRRELEQLRRDAVKALAVKHEAVSAA